MTITEHLKKLMREVGSTIKGIKDALKTASEKITTLESKVTKLEAAGGKSEILKFVMQDERLPTSMKKGRGYMRLIVDKNVAVMQVKATPSATGRLSESSGLGLPNNFRIAFEKLGFASIATSASFNGNPFFAAIHIDNKGYINVHSDKVFINVPLTGSVTFFITEDTMKTLPAFSGFTQVKEF